MDITQMIQDMRKELHDVNQTIAALRIKAKALGQGIYQMRELQQQMSSPQPAAVCGKRTSRREDPPSGIHRPKPNGYLHRGSKEAGTTLADYTEQVICAYGPMVVSDIELALHDLFPDLRWAKGSIGSTMSSNPERFSRNAETHVWSLSNKKEK